MKGSAIISEDGLYRYWLTRRWEAIGKVVNWIMLNPSTADAETNDPTISRCIRFSQDWGFNALIVTNLFAYRATDPKDLQKVSDPVGPKNEVYMRAAMTASNLVVCAWGAGREKVPLVSPAPFIRPGSWCLGKTRAGHPRHPLYVRADTILEAYKEAEVVSVKIPPTRSEGDPSDQENVGGSEASPQEGEGRSGAEAREPGNQAQAEEVTWETSPASADGS